MAQPGALDPTFNRPFDVNVLPQDYGSYINRLIVQPDGKILIAGVLYDGNMGTYIKRLNKDGTLDESFTTPITTWGVNFNAITLQADGKILIPGSNSELIRLNNSPKKR